MTTALFFSGWFVCGVASACAQERWSRTGRYMGLPWHILGGVLSLFATFCSDFTERNDPRV